VFSHLAASEDPSEDAFTRQQISDFSAMADEIARESGHSVMRHILNSTGVMRFPEAHFEMVRLGIGLYGFSPLPQATDKLLNVSTFKTRVTQIKEVASGGSVGYNRRFRPEKGTRIAIVPVGYADGLNRQLGNGRGSMLVKGIRCPIIGSICMDMAMLDIGDADIVEGDEVVIFGDEIPASGMAGILGTIPYEILTGISRRVKRVYYHE
jgi:alanine racemase